MRCGIDSTDVSRLEKLIADHDRQGLSQFFSEEELKASEKGESFSAEKLASRFAVKEACAKLFPKEIGLGTIEPTDFSVSTGGYGEPAVQLSERAEAIANKHAISDISISTTHTPQTATAIAIAQPSDLRSPWYGKLVYRLIPLRKSVVTENLNRAFGDSLTAAQQQTIAERFYAHFLLCFLELFTFRLKSKRRLKNMIRIEGGEHLERALKQNRGALILTGHFGNWEVATTAGLSDNPQFRGRFHFIRKPLKPKWFNRWIRSRFQKSGFGTLEKEDSLDQILELLEANNIIVNVYDQFAIKSQGIPSEFFGHPAHTFKSVPALAQFSQAPVIPGSSWREPDGTHVLCFEPELKLLTEGRTRDLLIKNSKLCNQALERIILRHPEQWIWMHKRWKPV